ncbi:PREDICTED: putative F-box/LRR-repeat protein At5g02700 [Nicotiana attenuata]|uniref:putative F-box/LRR-repeat protein At5g02700 n=1 Tax=Nicotiana attenuata TaxID=49451 RepID=UPI000904E6CC|nr:PREDICTED: putative F-box/LRR-repeat protein At5g02700 [Nicotiana attenuata]
MAPDHSRKHTPSSKKQKVRATGAEKRKKRVTGVEETLDDRIEWKSLKSLKLKYTVLDDDAIVNNILSGSPALETLEFFNFEGFRRLEINSLNLQRLKFKEYWLPNDSDDHSLEIVAPYIQHLEISKNLYDLKCRLINAASVVSARLTFRITCSEYSSDSCPDDHQVIKTLVQEYFQKLSCATELTIGTWFTEVMLPFEGGLLLPELKCKCLTLDLHITKFYSYGAAILLQASPHVETLNITMATIDHLSFFAWFTYSKSHPRGTVVIIICPEPLKIGGFRNCSLDFSRCKFELGYLAKGGDIHLLSRFGFPNLRNVKVVSSSGTCLQGCLVWDYDELFNLSEFILKNAMGLEKISRQAQVFLQAAFMEYALCPGLHPLKPKSILHS